MANLRDQPEAEEVCEDLRDVIDDGGNTEECRRASVILKMPEQECEDKADSEAHKPSDEQEGGALQILELLQHRDPFGHFARCLGKHLGL